MNQVRAIRKKAGISQARLRRSLGWTQSRLANYESGFRRPGLTEARQIVSALNLLGAQCELDEAFPPASVAEQPRVSDTGRCSGPGAAAGHCA
jgi:putative transcriptional regulator